MQTQAPHLFERVSRLMEELGIDKEAAAREKRSETGIPDPGGFDGPTSHPSKKTDDNLQPAEEGSQSADNTAEIKSMIPDSIDSKPIATPENTPKVTDNQLGQGVDKAKPTGEDPSTEDDYKGTPEGDKQDGDMGGTSHPATGDYGEKYSADRVARMSTRELCKAAADLGNEIAADIASGAIYGRQQPTTKQAAYAGRAASSEASNIDETLDAIASDVVQSVVKNAYDDADNVAAYLAHSLVQLQKQAEGEMMDPAGGGDESEDHGSDEYAGMPGEEMPPEGGMGGEELPPEAAELLAAMSGMEGGGMGGEEDMGLGGGDPGLGGGDPGLGGMGGPEEGPAIPDSMGEDEAIQELAMALLESGIDPQELMQTADPMGEKMASAVHRHKRAGKFQVTVAKQGSAARRARDYMKDYVGELLQRSRR